LLNVDWSIVSRLDEWAKRRYLALVEEVGAGDFTTGDVEEVLSKRGLGMENVNKLLSVLRKEGLVEVEENPKDFRRSIYRLVLLGPAVSVRKHVDKYVGEGFSREEAYLLANSDYLVLYDDRERRLYSWRDITKSRETVKEFANAIIKISRLNEGLPDLQKCLISMIFQRLIMMRWGMLTSGFCLILLRRRRRRERRILLGRLSRLLWGFWMWRMGVGFLIRLVVRVRCL